MYTRSSLTRILSEEGFRRTLSDLSKEATPKDKPENDTNNTVFTVFSDEFMSGGITPTKTDQSFAYEDIPSSTRRWTQVNINASYHMGFKGYKN